MVNRIRIDHLLIQKGLAENRSSAQKLIMAGKVRVDGQLVFKSSHQVAEGSDISIEAGPTYVSRGGEKLAAVLDQLEFSVENFVCADVGSSTGGFTDCLLQGGAKRVYAIDVGHGQLHWKLRNDPRVVVMERTNARYLERLDEKIDLVTIDVSFISLRLILEAVVKWISEEGNIIALIKPQFEAGKDVVSKGGVVRNSAIHKQVIMEVMNAAQGFNLYPYGLVRSPLRGPKGNVEFLAVFSQVQRAFDLDAGIERVVGAE